MIRSLADRIFEPCGGLAIPLFARRREEMRYEALLEEVPELVGEFIARRMAYVVTNSIRHLDTNLTNSNFQRSVLGCIAADFCD